MNKDILDLVKDIGLGLIQISGLLLTINLAVISSTAQQEIIDRIEVQIIISSILLSVSILLGILVLGLLTIIAESTTLNIKLQNVIKWISTFQSGTFFISMAFMVWAVILRV